MTTAAHQAADTAADGALLLPFTESHLAGALALSQEMSWPYRLEDWQVALQLGRGFVLQRAGTVIGTAAWWAYGEAHASAGMIIVAKSAQGRGHGARLMDALLAAVPSRTVVLNSTAEGMALYQRRGFVQTGVIHQHQGVLHRPPSAPPASAVREMLALDVDAVARLDRQATGWSRRAMLDRFIQMGEGHVLLRHGLPHGYAISRPFGRGHVIGPVVADNPADARALVRAALARLGHAFVRVDTAATSQLGPWLESIGLPQVGDASTMVRGKPLEPPGPACMFALANQSFN
jgi:predicted GNAT family N-acyltransferase